MKKIEKILILLITIALIFKIIPVAGGGAMLTIAMCGLAWLYMMFGFALFNGIGFRAIFKKASYAHAKPIQIVSGIIGGFSIAMMLTGVLFKMQYWPGAAIQLFATLLIGSITTIVAIVRYLSSGSDFTRRVLTRAIPICAIAMMLYIIPSDQLKKVIKIYPYAKEVNSNKQN